MLNINIYLEVIGACQKTGSGSARQLCVLLRCQLTATVSQTERAQCHSSHGDTVKHICFRVLYFNIAKTGSRNGVNGGIRPQGTFEVKRGAIVQHKLRWQKKDEHLASRFSYIDSIY